MPNHLKYENSPYLLQHVDNPVDWYPWGEEALEIAHAENKPIFLSIGYAACHWCHVMAHESFEDPETAALMNREFVNIKVDREERPDIDHIYMNAVVTMTKQGGWPLSVFLTPEGQPFYGGTYFPPSRRYNMPSFQEVLESVARLWKEDRDRILDSSEQITEHLIKTNQVNFSRQSINREALEQAVMQLAQTYDWENGGWGNAPKFPQPMAIEFLLRRVTVDDRMARDLAYHALDAMAKGGMYDVVGGGFARYSTDDNWLVPHFEKMLYDNAQLARVYLHAYLTSGRAHYRRVCEETLDFLQRELMYDDPSRGHCGFYSSLDADSEGEEGKFYIWEKPELLACVRLAQQGWENRSNSDVEIDWVDLFSEAYDLPSDGNFEGQIILQKTADESWLAERFNVSEQLISKYLDHIHQGLLESRSDRIRPGTDDKILTAWNGFALITFSEAARYLKRDDYLETAQRNARFLLDELYQGDRLLRSWRNGIAKHNAYLEDYAALILGLIALYQSDSDNRWFSVALRMMDELLTNFRDPSGGFYDTRADHEELVIRPKELQDNATPAGNSLTVQALLQLNALDNHGDWRSLAEEMLESIINAAIKYPTAFSEWLSAADFALSDNQEIALIGDRDDPGMAKFIDTVWSSFQPNSIVSISSYPIRPESPALLDGRYLIDEKPTAYVCQNFICQKPTTSVQEFREQIS